MTDADPIKARRPGGWHWRVSLYFISAGLGMLFLLSTLERNVLFPNPKAPTTPPALPENAHREMLKTPAGTIEVVLLAPETASSGTGASVPAPVVIYCHGNGELIDYSLESFEAFRQAGFAILLAEYPGYGRTTGTPGEKSFQQALAAAYDWVIVQPGIDPKKVIGHGRSLGGGAICSLASVRPLAAIVLESSFTSITDTARVHYGWLAWFVRNRFDNLAVVKTLKCPVLILHGSRDVVIPAVQATRLHEACPGSELKIFPRGHSDLEEAFPVTLSFLLKHSELMPTAAVPAP